MLLLFGVSWIVPATGDPCTHSEGSSPLGKILEIFPDPEILPQDSVALFFKL